MQDYFKIGLDFKTPVVWAQLYLTQPAMQLMVKIM